LQVARRPLARLAGSLARQMIWPWPIAVVGIEIIGKASGCLHREVPRRKGTHADDWLDLRLPRRLEFVAIDTIWGVMGPDPESVGTRGRPAAGTGIAARLSRRQVLRRGAVAFGGVAGLGLLDPSELFGSAFATPRPIPGGFDLNFNIVPSGAFIHVIPPSVGLEMSSITDFNGVIGGSETQGTARGSDGTRYSFDCDMRFMRGAYVGVDGRLHNGSFGFI